MRALEVIEQRASHFVMGLALIGTMSGPLLIILHTIPLAVLGGVFFVVGVSLIRAFKRYGLLSDSEQLT